MGREIEVQTDALMSLSRDYRRYGQNIYSKYRSGSSRIESELSSILSKYSDYSSVTSKVYSIQNKLRETEQYIKRLEEKSNKISTGLTEAVRAYTSSEQDAKELLNKNKLRIDGLGGRPVITRVNIGTKVVSQQEESIGDKIGNLWEDAVDKIKDVVEDATDFVTHFDLSATISGINKKFQDTVSNIKENVSDAVTHFRTQVSDFAEKVKGNVINFASGVKDKWDDFTSGVSNFFKKAKDTLADFGEKLLDGINNIVDRFSQVVGDTIDYIIEHRDDIIKGLKKAGVILLDGAQFVLDILGFIPVAGEIADAANGLIYLARGDYLNAGLSFAACIPFAGWAATGGKIIGKVAKVIDKIGDVSKIVDKVKDVAKVVLKYGDDAVKFILKKGDNVINFLTKKGDEIWNFISNSKIYNKVDEIINLISKKAEDIQSFLAKQVEKISGEAIENTVEKEVKEEIVEELAEKAFKDIDFKDIEKVVEEGDILKVKLKDGTDLSYKKADLSAEELKKLEDGRLIEGVSNADSIIDGLEVVDGKVKGKIPVDEFKNIRAESIQNINSDTITLGKYKPTVKPDGTLDWTIPGKDSYTVMAGDTTYFSLGNDWDVIKNKYNITDDDMFDLFNVPALDDAVKSGKEIRYSHHPEQYGDCALLKEWEYLKGEYGFKRLIKEGEFWYAIK